MMKNTSNSALADKTIKHTSAANSIRNNNLNPAKVSIYNYNSLLIPSNSLPVRKIYFPATSIISPTA